MSPKTSSEQLALQFCQQAEQFVTQKQWDAACHCYQQAIDLTPQSFKIYHQLASVFVQRQQWQNALTAYQNAIQLKPDFCWSYTGLGKVLIQLERWQEAITVYQTAIQLNPEFCWSYYHLGKVYFKLQDWKKAIDAFEAAIQSNPNFSQFHQDLGKAALKLQQWEKAVMAFQKLIELDSTSLGGYIGLAEALSQLDQWQDAVTIYRRMMASYPEELLNASHWLKMGKALSQIEEFTEAIACYQKAIALEPKEPWFYYFIGDAFQKKQQQELALKTYQQAIKLGLDFPLLSIRLGDLYTEAEEYQQATIAYQQASYQTVMKAYPKFDQKEVILQPSGLPHFLMIGAAKCGTTSLYRNITQHPQVLPALKKEIDFWHNDLKQGFNWYRAHFLPFPQGQHYLTGEASPHYLDLQETAQRVFKFCPKMKLIVILRNPVQRLVSHYYHWVRLNQEHRSLAEVIETELQTIDQLLQFPIQAQSWYQSVNYIARGVYIGFIQQWMQVFPPEQFLILNFETLASQPAVTMKQVFSFLGLPDSRISSYTQLNTGDYSPLSSVLSQTLSQFYSPYNQQLEEFLGMELGWNESE